MESYSFNIKLFFFKWINLLLQISNTINKNNIYVNNKKDWLNAYIYDNPIMPEIPKIPDLYHNDEQDLI